jgi:putative toxin-antitoxin system antitoxin component (TIGR02293 family)
MTQQLDEILAGSGVYNPELMTLGMDWKVVEEVKERLGVADKGLSEWASIPPRTFSRRKKEGRLKPTESERVLRFAQLHARATEFFSGDADKAREWLFAPKSLLSGASPMEYARSESGARFVFDLLGRLEHGVFS